MMVGIVVFRKEEFFSAATVLILLWSRFGRTVVAFDLRVEIERQQHFASCRVWWGQFGHLLNLFVDLVCIGILVLTEQFIIIAIHIAWQVDSRSVGRSDIVLILLFPRIPGVLQELHYFLGLFVGLLAEESDSGLIEADTFVGTLLFILGQLELLLLQFLVESCFLGCK